MLLCEVCTPKKFGHFSAIFWKIGKKIRRCFFRPLRFLRGHFCVLRPKFRPVGNSITAVGMWQMAWLVYLLYCLEIYGVDSVLYIYSVRIL
jgi:hypothetical protein